MKKERPVREAILAFADRHAMLPPGTSVLVGFSGGADSVCLLSILWEAAPERQLRVGAVHLNHCLRGESSDRDERFCREFCESRGIPFFSVSRSVAEYAAAHKMGTEEAARAVRYAVFEEIADRNGFGRIATAHNADDQLETLLFRLARGTGVAGLRGIPPVRGRFLRPMLRVGKEEVLRYLAENGLPHVTDETNADPSYSRNYIRSELVPRMKKVNPGALRAAADLSECAAEDDSYLSALAEAYSLSDGAQKLYPLPDPILRRVLRREAEAKGMSLSFPETTEAVKVVRSRASRASAPMPGRNDFRKDRDTLFFGKGESTPWDGMIPAERESCFLLRPEGREDAVFYAKTPLSPEACSIIKDLKNIYKLSMQANLNSDKIGKTIILRSRLPGDRYRFRGMTRSVKKLLGEKKLTDAQRDSLPVFDDTDGILWIPGFPPREEGCGAVLLYFSDDPSLSSPEKQPEKESDHQIERDYFNPKMIFQKERNQAMSQLNDMESILVSEEQISEAVTRIAGEIDDYYKDSKRRLVLLGILKGSVVFMGDLMKKITLPVEIDFMKVSSYGGGTKTSGKVNIILDLLRKDLENCDILVVEDIIDSGRTLSYLTEYLKLKGAGSVRTVTLLDKPDRREVNFMPDHVGFSIPDAFVVGYGLDYAEAYRALPYVGILKPEIYSK